MHVLQDNKIHQQQTLELILCATLQDAITWGLRLQTQTTEFPLLLLLVVDGRAMKQMIVDKQLPNCYLTPGQHLFSNRSDVSLKFRTFVKAEFEEVAATKKCPLT